MKLLKTESSASCELDTELPDLIVFPISYGKEWLKRRKAA